MCVVDRDIDVNCLLYVDNTQKAKIDQNLQAYSIKKILRNEYNETYMSFHYIHS